MSLLFKTSADLLYTEVVGDADAVLAKYSYTTDITPDQIVFSLDNSMNWGFNKEAHIRVTDTEARKIVLTDFVYADVDLHQSEKAEIHVDGAKRGDIVTGDGNDQVSIAVLNSINAGHPGWDNPALLEHSRFTVDTGAGNDFITFTLGTLAPGLNKDVSHFTSTYINSGDGNDIIDLRGTDAKPLNTIDFIDAGTGNDHIYSGGGKDEIHAGAGDDYAEGSRDDDLIYGDDGKDELHGFSGNDTLYGGADDDLVDGGSGTDYVYGGDGVDFVLGRPGDDFVFGENGDDKVTGSTGKDFLTGGAGADQFIITNSDLILDDAAVIKQGTRDTITDFDAAEGDRINVDDAAAWSFSTDGTHGTLTNASLLAGSEIYLENVNTFDMTWLI
jgi:Ca2+-binding RTX toxin-like protein